MSPSVSAGVESFRELAPSIYLELNSIPCFSLLDPLPHRRRLAFLPYASHTSSFRAMAEVQPRGSGTRGRGGFRGGRGGFRGGRHPSRSQHKADNEQENIPPTSLEDQGEVGELKKKFGDKVPLLKEICPGWSDEDLVYALNETDGDVNEAVDRISSGKKLSTRILVQ